MKNAGNLKLFVVGESSGNPDEWSERSLNRTLVLARDSEEAERICDEIPGEAFEVCADRAMVVAYSPIV